MHFGQLKNLHYAWVMVIVGFGIAFTSAISIYSFGLFLKPLAETFNTNRAVISGASSVSSIIGAAMGLLSGRLTDKHGPRLVLAMLGVLSGTGYILLSRVGAIWQIYLSYIILGLFTFQIPVFTTVPRWFNTKREIALGVVQTGFGIGGIVLVPAVQYFISGSGWRQGYLFVGLITLCVITPLAFFMKHSPQRAGKEAYGVADPKAKKPAVSDADSMTPKEAVRTARFWTVGALMFCYMWILAVMEVHIAPYATDIKMSAAAAAIAVSFLSGFGILGKMSIGFISEKKGIKVAIIIYLAIMTLSLGQLLLIRGAVPLYVFAAIFGIGYGGIITITPSITAELFGMKYLSSIYAGVMFFSTAGRAIGPAVAGNIFDRTGNYSLAFLVSFILSGIALALAFILRSRRMANRISSRLN